MRWAIKVDCRPDSWFHPVWSSLARSLSQHSSTSCSRLGPSRDLSVKLFLPTAWSGPYSLWTRWSRASKGKQGGEAPVNNWWPWWWRQLFAIGESLWRGCVIEQDPSRVCHTHLSTHWRDVQGDVIVSLSLSLFLFLFVYVFISPSWQWMFRARWKRHGFQGVACTQEHTTKKPLCYSIALLIYILECKLILWLIKVLVATINNK